MTPEAWAAFATLAGTFLVTGAGGLIFVGKLAQRVTSLESRIKSHAELDDRIRSALSDIRERLARIEATLNGGKQQ